MVEHDSIIPAGRVGKVIQAINIDKLHAGPFTKTIKVMSNAKNTDVLRLSMSGKVLTNINISERFLNLHCDKNGTASGILVLGTEKPDFKIKEMIFSEHPTNDPSWQKMSPVDLKFSTTRSDSADADGYYTYTVQYSLDIKTKIRLSGDFKVLTNHPKEEVIELRGMIAPLEEPMMQPPPDIQKQQEPKQKNQ